MVFRNKCVQIKSNKVPLICKGNNEKHANLSLTDIWAEIVKNLTNEEKIGVILTVRK